MDSRFDLSHLPAGTLAAIQERVSAVKQQRLARYPEDALLWLALTPFWTVNLAEICGFPTGSPDVSVRDLFTNLYEEGFCEFTPARPKEIIDPDSGETRRFTDNGDDSFSMVEALRNEIIQRRSTVAGEMERTLAQIGRAIWRKYIFPQDHSRPSVAPFLGRWATLAEKAADDLYRPYPGPGAHITIMTSSFAGRVDDLLRVAERSNSDDPRAIAAMNDLQGWIESARPLETIFGGELSIAITRVARRLELLHRRSYDEQHLARFLPRAEQLQAFTDLLTGDDKLWALHFTGQGGIGKTMLLRYITARYFADSEHRPAISRIDFDYLNPDYPSRAPALLLDQLSQELRLYGDFGADKSFARFDRLVIELQDQVSSSTSGPRNVAEVLASAQFRELLDVFLEALKQLPQPVILILDTCEELAKLRPDGSIPDNITATFTILEYLHHGLSSLRVVFSGRRPLASLMHDWECESSPLPARAYLRLYEIRGFDKGEARDYLLDHAHIRESLVDAICDKSRVQSGGSLFKRLDATVERVEIDQSDMVNLYRYNPPVVEQEPKDLYNPFDLALYAAWANEEPTLTAEAIRDATIDRYVESRIIRRIRHPRILELLPAVALLGQFDREMLRVVSHSDDQGFGDIFHELASQEWVQLQGLNTWVLRSDVRERLATYFRRQDPRAIAQACGRLAQHLSTITLNEPLSKLNIIHFDAAIRLLEEADPQLALDWWRQVEQRFLNEQAYEWAITLIEQLIAEGGAVEKASQDKELAAFSQFAHGYFDGYVDGIRSHDPVSADWWRFIEGWFVEVGYVTSRSRGWWYDWAGKRVRAEQRDRTEGKRARKKAMLDGSMTEKEALNELQILRDEWRGAEEEYKKHWSEKRAFSPRSQGVSLLRSSVLATYACALLHARPLLGRGDTWEEVELAFPRKVSVLDTRVRAQVSLEPRPTPQARIQLSPAPMLLPRGIMQGLPPSLFEPQIPEYLEFEMESDGRLRARAFFGRLAANRQGINSPDLETLLGLLNVLKERIDEIDEQMLAAIIAALESFVEYIESYPDHGLFPDQPQAEDDPRSLQTLLAFLDKLKNNVKFDLATPELAAFAMTLAGRVALIEKQWQRAQTYFDQALTLLPTITPGQQSWLDWLAPEDLPARVRLEYARAMYPAVLSPNEVLAKIETPLSRQHNPDTLTLASAQIFLRDAIRCPSTKGIPIQLGLPSPQRGPLCNALRAFVPYNVAIYETLAATGDVATALQMLQTIAHDAQQSSDALDTQRAADRAILRVVRRMRLRDERIGLENSLEGSEQLEDRELLWSLSALESNKVTAQLPIILKPDVALGHVLWRTTYGLRHNQSYPIGLPGWTLQESAVPDKLASLSFHELSSLLDLLEAREFYSTSPPEKRPTLPLLYLDVTPMLTVTTQWPMLHPERPEEALRLLLRANALRQAGREHPIPEPLVERLGRRRAAEIAQDEGELLALRLPQRALYLLQRAWDWFVGVEDTIGTFISSTSLALTYARLAQQNGWLDQEQRRSHERYLRRWLERIDKTYQTLRDASVLRPSWRLLENMATFFGADYSQELVPLEWRPWLVRLLACMMVTNTGPARSQRLQSLLGWVGGHYGVRLLDGQYVLPAELDLWLDAATREAESSEAKYYNNPLSGIVPPPVGVFPGQFALPWQPFEPGQQVKQEEHTGEASTTPPPLSRDTEPPQHRYTDPGAYTRLHLDGVRPPMNISSTLSRSRSGCLSLLLLPFEVVWDWLSDLFFSAKDTIRFLFGRTPTYHHLAPYSRTSKWWQNEEKTSQDRSEQLPAGPAASAPSQPESEETLKTPLAELQPANEPPSQPETSNKITLAVSAFGKASFESCNVAISSFSGSFPNNSIDGQQLFEARSSAPYTESAQQLILPPIRRPFVTDPGLLIELMLDREVSPICWEALVTLNLLGPNSSHQLDYVSGPQFCRTLPARQVRHVGNIPSQLDALGKPSEQNRLIKPPQIHAVGNLSEHNRFINELWRKRISLFGGRVDDYRYFNSSSFGQASEAAIIHLIAPAIRTSSGIMLDIGYSLVQQNQQMKQSSNNLIKCEELLNRFPSMTVCILQAPPAPLASRTETDRIEAAAIRRLAADLHYFGIPIVITIPQLPTSMALAAMQPIVDAIDTANPLSTAHRLSLLDALQVAQLTIFSELGSTFSRYDLIELAFDLSLYFPLNYELISK